MACPKCGAPYPANAAFCSACGQALPRNPTPVSGRTQGIPAPAAGSPQIGPGQIGASQVGASQIGASQIGAGHSGAIVPPDVFAATHAATRTKAWGITLGLGALLLAGGYGLSKAGLLSARGSRSGQSLSVAGADAPPILRERGADAGSALKAGAVATTMPQDVLDWLNHLKDTEQKKRDLTASETRELQLMLGQANATSGLMNVNGVNDMTDPDSTSTQPPVVDQLQKLIEKQKQEWYQLSEFFKSKPAPAECESIEAAYDQGLTQMGQQMSNLAGIPGTASTEAATDQDAARDHGTAEVNDISANHPKVIDDQFQAALDGFHAICAKYKTTPWFGIDVHGDQKNSLEGGP